MGGIDMRWRTPLEGLTLGTAHAKVSRSAPNARIGRFPIGIEDRYQQQELYAQLEKGKVTISGEWKLNPVFIKFGPAPESYAPMRAWYAMVSYRATQKLTLGTYYDQMWFFLANRDRKVPSIHLKDVAVSGRYNFNRYFYAKLEGHYMDGNSGGFYRQVNPNGLQKTTSLLLGRFGFAF